MSGPKGTGMKGIIGYDLLRLDGYMAWQTEEVDGTVYDYISLTEEEKAEVYGTRFGHGVNLSTFEHDLRAGAFW